jgi:chromosome segregation ATPase
MIQKTKQWLSNPSRSYAEGLEIFNKFASPEIREKYTGFLEIKDGEENVKAFDMRFQVLINKVSAIFANMKLNPEKYQPAAPADASEQKSFREDILEKAKTIRELKAEKERLEDNLQEFQSSDEEKQEEIDGLQSELEEKEERIAELETDLQSKLSLSGLKVVKYDDLPKDIKALYDRTKEIVPLMAKIHSEFSDPNLTDADRKARAQELCTLDDERRSIWDKIDAWSEGKDCVLDAPKEAAFSNDPLVRGMQISKRMTRLEENIVRTGKSIEGHVKSGKKNLEAKSRTRLAAYERELAELKAVLVNE